MRSLGRGLKMSVDIVIVMDVTGSMYWCIREVAEEVCGFAEDLAGQGLDWRIALYAFRDLKVGQEPEPFPFTSDVREFQALVQAQKARGGGSNGGESSIDALFDSLSKYPFRANAARAFVMFTDDRPHDPDECGRTLTELVGALRSSKVVSYVVSKPIDPWLQVADSYGGLQFDIETARGDFRQMFLNVSRSISACHDHAPSLKAAVARAMSTPPKDERTRVMGKRLPPC